MIGFEQRSGGIRIVLCREHESDQRLILRSKADIGARQSRDADVEVLLFASDSAIQDSSEARKTAQSERIQQCLFVGKMPTRRVITYSNFTAEISQGEALDATFVERLLSRSKQSCSQVPMMIRTLFCSLHLHSFTLHHRARQSPDNVSIDYIVFTGYIVIGKIFDCPQIARENRIMNVKSNTIVITGGGTGIGRALAQRWHDRGNYVIVVGRRREALDEAIHGRPRMSAYTFDIDDADAISMFARRIVSEHPNLNVLVNNAGIYQAEDPGAERDLAGAEKMIATNLLGPIRLINALIDHLKTRPGAAIVNISSGLAFVPYPAAPTYSATRAALHSYTVALRARLKRVEVVEIIPPQVQTELSPGQSKDENSMPLDAFADEVMSLLERYPTPPEICVDRVKLLRYAETESRFNDVLSFLSEH